MDYKIFWKTLILILGFSFFQTGCSEKDDQKEQVTYYVEIGNCMDSLKNKLDAGINGKVSYYQNNQLNVLSLNYVTGQFPDMHYFKSIQELRSPIPEGTKKIRVEFAGNLTNDEYAVFHSAF
ncbi:MAG: hypothetical protein IPI66_10270 [Chitinophagaceae bacterium]|nr:hypothetical protein [Chitinophagaceae bacterium]